MGDSKTSYFRELYQIKGYRFNANRQQFGILRIQIAKSKKLQIQGLQSQSRSYLSDILKIHKLISIYRFCSLQYSGE